MTPSFTPGTALAGGILIGLSASGVLLLLGRIAGISGILGGVLFPTRGETGWRWAFLGGLFAGGLLLRIFAPNTIGFPAGVSLPTLAVAGFLVGMGTRWGKGCTSGHGVCGIARFSRRGIIATCVFMLAGFCTVFVTRHWGGLP